MSAVTFAVELPGEGGGFRKIAERGGISRSLESHRDEFLRSDYLRVDPVDQAELWRLSLRLGALQDVDYGAFVGELKQTVEPVLSAYKYRAQILKAIQDARGADSVRKTRVYLAGVPFGRSPSAPTPLPESPGEPASVAGEAKDPGQLKTEREAVETMLFAKILGRLLKNAGLDLQDWHDPRFELPNDWPGVLGRQDLVVFVDPRGPYSLEDLQAHAPLLVDARDHLYSSGQPTAAERKEAVAAVYTGLVPVVYKAQRTLLESLIVSTIWAFGMIAVVMILVVRSIPAGLLSMLPNVFPVMVVFGLMGWSNVLVDIGSMMTASVAMGVAVDDTIHFLTWFRRGLDSGLKRRDAILRAYEHVGMAMTQTTAIGGLGLSIFAFSTFTPNAALRDPDAGPARHRAGGRSDLPAGPAGRPLRSRLRRTATPQAVGRARCRAGDQSARQRRPSRPDAALSRPNSAHSESLGEEVGRTGGEDGPLIRPAATFSREGRRDRIVSPLPRPGEVARGPLAGPGRVRVEPFPARRGPLIRPSATFSRVGEKGHDRVTSPEAGRGRSGPACGTRAGEGRAFPGARGPLIRPSATFSRVGEKGHDRVTSPEAGRGRSEQVQDGLQAPESFGSTR